MKMASAGVVLGSVVASTPTSKSQGLHPSHTPHRTSGREPAGQPTISLTLLTPWAKVAVVLQRFFSNS